MPGAWVCLLIISLLLIILITPVTPLLERFDGRYPPSTTKQSLVIEEPPEESPPPGLMMNGPKEAEDLHKSDINERLAKFFDPKLPEDETVWEGGW